MRRVDRPRVDWQLDRPPPNEKVVALTRWGVLVLGPVTGAEWDNGTVVCWVPCPKRPTNWDALLDEAQRRAM